MFRLSAVLFIALMLSACTAHAFGEPGSVVVDVVGSTIDNTRITTTGHESVELEFVGSVANNTVIAPPERKPPVCPPYVCPEMNCGCVEESGQCQQKRYPWEDMHLGVDAWYGTFWYTDINMPKWPQF